MHYCVHLLTKELPSENQIADIMNPYYVGNVYSNLDEENEDYVVNYPTFTWDCYQIGGRYKAEIKLKVDAENKGNNEYYNWGYYSRDERNGRLFWSSLLSTLKECMGGRYSEEDWFANMGFYDKYILVDGARQKDIVNLPEMDCYVCILPDGTAIARASWNGTSFVEDKDFDRKHKEALGANMDGFITVLDVHD